MHSQHERAARAALRIAFCLPEQQWLPELISGEFTDAAHIQQGYIAQGLQSKGHNLTYVAPYNLNQIAYARKHQAPMIAPQTWSGRRWFAMSSKGCWLVQQALGVPYLNVFSNYQRFDACMQCLPGHDLVQERNGLYNAGVAMACKRLNLPYLLFFDADQLLEHDFMGKPITGLLRWRAQNLLRYNLAAARCIICVSEPAKAHLVKNWRVPADKIAVFPNGVDVQRFRPDSAQSDPVRASLGMSANLLIGFVGNFYEWHDTATLLNAFASVVPRYPQARLVLVGDGPQRQAMVELSAKLGIAASVHFTGSVAHTQVPAFMSMADIAVAPVSPMKQDLWLSPMKLFEYMASGTAIVATALGQITEVIQDGQNGLLVRPGDIANMAAALQRLIEEPNLRLRLGQRAREDAVRKYSWEHYVARLENLYTVVLADRPVALI